MLWTHLCRRGALLFRSVPREALLAQRDPPIPFFLLHVHSSSLARPAPVQLNPQLPVFEDGNLRDLFPYAPPPWSRRGILPLAAPDPCDATLGTMACSPIRSVVSAFRLLTRRTFFTEGFFLDFFRVACHEASLRFPNALSLPDMDIFPSPCSSPYSPLL